MNDVPLVRDELKKAGVDGRCAFVVGGAPVTEQWAETIGADGTAEDAAGAARLCEALRS
jgi:5-methyltetrahydrofolate--homocysteine methyltransferase